VGPDTLVAIAVERSLEMVIALLGILKAGGAYVPLDSDYPSDRLQFILQDTNASLLITQSFLQDKLDSLLHSYSGKIVFLDRALIDNPDFFYHNVKDKHIQNAPVQTLSSYPKKNPKSSSSPLNLAYIIYTSGSTGKPKGVLTYHHNVTRLFATTHAWFNFNDTDVWSCFHSYAFDFSIWEIWGALSYGGQVAIVSYEVSRSPDLFYNFLIKNKVTILNQTPSAFLQLIKHIFHIEEDNSSQQPSSKPLAALRFVIFGGEALRTDALSPYLQSVLGEDTCLINMYGITETTVHVTYAPFDRNFAQHQSFIGKKLTDLTLYLLDEQMQPVPIGVRGEIYIGGEGLARGYLNRPDLTAERFVPNPFPHTPSSSLRLYKTGDIARYLHDGNIEFLGRSDDQVKIRGFRIECGEIETTLSAHGEVASSLVIPREDDQGHKRLIAYVIPKNTSDFQEEDSLSSSTGETFKRLLDTSSFTETLRSYLATSLPDYMIPAFFVLLNRLPLTPNGKIDKAALPDPDLSSREDEFVPPSNKIEEDLSLIWSEVLGISPISIHDNFFRIGGHSLLATQVISRIRQTFSKNIPIRAIFDSPTIKGLALLISQTQTSDTPPIVAAKRPDVIPLSFAQERLWFLDQFLPNSPLYNLPVALRLKGPLHINALEKAFQAIIQRHESLRTSFPVVNGEAHQVILPPFSIHLEKQLQDLSNLAPQDIPSLIDKIAQEEATTPFDLSQGPLLRVKLLKVHQQEHVLLITMHHIISDAWSMTIFFNELSSLYNSLLEGKEPSLNPLPIQYADFALWQRNWLQGDVLDQQLDYWKQQLSGVPDLLELPTDKPRPRELSYNGGVYTSTLSKSLTEQLHLLAQENQASLFMTLLAIFQVLLYRYTRQQDIVVGSPIANRHHKETEDLIGFFVNTLALRTTFKSQQTFIDVLNEVKETTLHAYQHQDLPFEQLVDHLQIERVTNRNPLFQVMFALHNPTPEQTLTDLQISPLSLEHTISKFDLTLNMLEHHEGLSLSFEYAPELFDESSIKRMAHHLEGLIKECLKDPSQSIQHIPFLTENETQQLLIEWNHTTKDYPKEKTIHQLFEEQVKKSPHNVAVVYEDQELTYQQLNEKANQLAHLLQAQGVGPDTLVAIAVERSLEMVIALLGILKAGGAYVPLDSDYPSDRLQFILQDTNASLLITQSFLQDKLDSLLHSYSGKIVFLDRALIDNPDFFYHNVKDKHIQNAPVQTLSSYPKKNPKSSSSPLNLAYIIYTSGSTGKPKGINIDNLSVVNCIYAIRRAVQASSNGTSLALTSLSFDVAALDYYLPLSIGAKVIIVDSCSQKDGFKLVSLINKHSVSAIQATPSLFRMILVTEPSLNQEITIMLAGEILSQEILEKLVLGHQVFNIYGPTEATIYSSLSKLSQNTLISIGHPIQNVQTYILDHSMNPVPIGVRGEIYIGGEGLARGYLNRPDLTAERFVP
ncbi:MAG: amino acid adenylation domain-containing protein, partial [Caedimonadaceae bacterium]